MKLISKIIIAAAGVLVVSAALILFINSYRYNNVYIPEYLRMQYEAVDQLKENKACFETVAEAFADKYGELFTLKDDEADYGEIYYGPIYDSLNIDHGKDTTSSVSVETVIPKQYKYTFTQDQADAMKYILTELNYSVIRYCLLKDGSYYVYFCKDGVLRKPIFAVTNSTVPDEVLDFGIVYSSDGKTLSVDAQDIFYTEKEIISNHCWYCGYGVH